MEVDSLLEQRPGTALAGSELLDIASGLAQALTRGGCDPGAGTDRSGIRIVRTATFDVWLLSWAASTSVSPHDHGDSTGAFCVAEGQLKEVRWAGGARRETVLSAGEGHVVEQGQVHDVIGLSPGALSVHVYSPPLSTMAFFDDDGHSALYEEVVDEAQDRFGATGPDAHAEAGVESLLSDARRRIAPRARPEDLDAAIASGTIVVDTRPAGLRARDGVIPGAVEIERNVLEWRLDPTGSHRIEAATDPDRPVVVVCDEGYASSLAAASLLDLGRRNVTDLEGGFQAWRRRSRTAPVLSPLTDRSTR